MSNLTAVILAAGRGTRLGTALDGKPKGFLPFKDTTFIERALDILALANVAQTVIVTGHNAEFYESLANERGPSVVTLHNPEFVNKGSMQSLRVALEALTGGLLVMDADIVYERRAILDMVQSIEDNAILLSNISGAGDENFAWSVLDGGANERITHISKDIHVNANAPSGEHVGIVKIGPNLAQALLQTSANLQQALPLVAYEQCLTLLLNTHTMVPVRIPDLIWTEVDDLGMWNRAQESIFPLLRD